MRERLKKRGIELIAPYRKNNKQRRYEDGRKLRRYKRRWITFDRDNSRERTRLITIGQRVSSAPSGDTGVITS